MLPKIMRRPAHSVMIAVALAGVCACSDPLDSSEPPAPGLAYMRLTIETAEPAPSVMTLANGQTGNFRLPEGTSSMNITADWLNADRQVAPASATTGLEVIVLGAAFTKVTGTRGGTLSGLTPGVNIVQISTFRPANGQNVLVVILRITVGDCGNCADWDY